MNHDELIRGLRPVTDEEAARMVDPRTRAALAEHVMAAEPREAPARRRRVLFIGAPLLAMGAAAAVLASVVLSGSSRPGHRPEPINAQPAALTFSKGDGYLLVKVKDPLADPKRYKKEFAAHGMKIDLRLVPASPTVVGTVVMSELPSSVKTVPAKGECFSGGGACPVGVKIPLGFHGGGTIVFGRAARPGEKYTSTNSAFAPGEELHCVDLRGRTVDEALGMIRRKKITVALYHYEEKRADGMYGVNTPRRDKIPGNWYVSTAEPYAPGQIMLWVRPDRPGRGEDSAYYERLMRGCPR